jgi:hypothetical protein
MIYVLCNVVTGALLSISEQPINTEGHPLQVKTFDMSMPDLTKVEWDKGGLNFKPKSQSRIITKLTYLRRFNQDERIAIRSAAEASPQLQDYMALLELSEEISLDDPDTIAAVNMLEMVGLIAAGRAAEILA